MAEPPPIISKPCVQNRSRPLTSQPPPCLVCPLCLLLYDMEIPHRSNQLFDATLVRDDRTTMRTSLLVALLSPSAAFHLGQHRAPRPTSPRLSPVVAAAEKHATVIFLRHGQSEWNAASLFTGWADVPLTTLGKNEAAEGATQMWREGYKVDVAYTSLLKRAQQTLDIVLKITGQEDVPVHQNWRLNERMYAGLTRTLTLALAPAELEPEPEPET